MGRKRKLTDYLPVTKRGNKRDNVTKSKEEEGDDGERSVQRKRQSEERRAGDKVAALPELSTLDHLIQFDLDWRFGPCTGITRLERWNRAEELGLTPPKNIRDIIMANQADSQYQFNLWSSYAI